MTKNYKRFYIGLLLPLLLFACYFAASARLLKAAGEYMGMDEVIAKLDDTYGYYGPALSQKTFYFKQHLYAHIKPDVVAMGSSRALQFRREDFSASFANLGGLSGLDEVDEMARSAFATDAPKLLILGVDFWWFNKANENFHSLRSPEDAGMDLSGLLKPLGWLASGKMSPADAAAIMDGDVPDVGITALLRKDGFDRFGAYYYTSTWLGEHEADDVKFETTLKRIKEGNSVFTHGDTLSDLRWQKFEDLLDFLEERGIKVILFTPPLAPAAVDAMEEQQHHAYEPLMRARLQKTAKKRKLAFFDFHDPRAFGSEACEFTDGIHGGQVTYDRILMQMAIENEAVRKAAKLPDIAWNIRHYAGHASINDAETDFLETGCPKAHIEE
jgi:hypothetical protein